MLQCDAKLNDLMSPGSVNALLHLMAKYASRTSRGTDYIASGNVSRRRNRPTGKTFPLGPSRNQPPEVSKEEDTCVSDTIAAVQFQEKEALEDWMDGPKEIKTFGDN